MYSFNSMRKRVFFKKSMRWEFWELIHLMDHTQWNTLTPEVSAAPILLQFQKQVKIVLLQHTFSSSWLGVDIYLVFIYVIFVCFWHWSGLIYYMSPNWYWLLVIPQIDFPVLNQILQALLWCTYLRCNWIYPPCCWLPSVFLFFLSFPALQT